MRCRIGPNAVSLEWGSWGAMNVQEIPAKGSAGDGSVLAIGVLQQLAYQRSVPLGLRRMQAKCSNPDSSLICAGVIWKISEPPFSFNNSSDRPKNRV